jgi:pimeloyl-ACP methyl ester carboxylesterase
MILWIVAIVAFLLIAAGLVLLGTWLLHLRSAIDTCEAITTMGTGAAGQFSLSGLGASQECEFPAQDGVLLRGTYIRRRTSQRNGTAQRNGIVVFCHEYGGDRHVAAAYIAPLLARGFDVFTFDFRNHGDSERMDGYRPRSWATQYEVSDVLGAIDYLKEYHNADESGVALMGLSRGGCAAISAASRHDNIWAVVTDGAFESRWVTTCHIRRFMPQVVRLAPLLTLAPWFLHVFYGTVVHNLVARKCKHPCIKLKNDVRRIRQPVLMIHGGRDRTIPVELAHRLRRRLGTRARLWIVSNGGHNRSYRCDPAGYQLRVCRFLKKHAPRAPVRVTRENIAA